MAADGDQVIEANFRQSLRLLDWCTANAVPLIYASSAATYGDGSAGFSDEGGITELKRLHPLNLYGWSKHAFDLWATRQADAGIAPPLWAGLKFFNVFGPNEHHKGDMMSLVVKNHPRVIASETIPLFKSYRKEYADGEQLRDFVYVKDCAAALLWLWRHETDATVSGLYNLGTGQARSFLDLIRALGAACGSAPQIDFVDMPDAIRPNYQYFTQASMTKLRRAGYNAPFTPLEEAVRDCVTQHLSQSDPYL